MSAILIIFGSYLAVFIGVSVFDLPKMFCICLGAVLVPWKARTALRTPFLLLIGAALVSVMASDTPIQGLLGRQGSATLGCLGIIAAWMAYEAGCGFGKDCTKWVLQAAIICAIIAIVQYFVDFPFPAINHRAYGAIGSPPLLGCMLALALPLLITKPLTFNWKVLIKGTIICLGIYFSGSRAGGIGAAAGITWVLVNAEYRLFTFLCIGAVATLFAVRAQGDAIRLAVWPLAWRAFKTHPLLGVGPDCFGDFVMRFRDSSWPANPEHVADHAHNLALHVLATTGILGAFSWLNLLWRAPMTPSLVAVLAYSMFNPVPFQGWCIIAFLWGSSEVALSGPKSEVLAMENVALGSST